MEKNDRMANTTQRVLQLLGLLQARTTWQASALAAELGVTERTVRRDIARLRDMGYPVNSSSGIEGGYQLGTGRHLPPLLLDDTEAVALVASLRMMALNGTDNAGTAALRALAKIDHILPPHLRALASAVDNATTALPYERPTVELQLLTQLATSQQDHTLVRFTYSKPNGTSSTREVEPARLMTQGELWYLQAFDKSRDDWRTFRLDRISNAQTTCWGFTPKVPPPPDFSSDITKRYPCVIRVELESSPELVAERIPPPYRTDLEVTKNGCTFLTGAPNWDDLAWHLLWVCRDLDCRMKLDASTESDHLRAALHDIGQAALLLAQA